MQVTVNGVDATASNHKQAYVMQEDVFFSQLTVWEVRRTHAGPDIACADSGCG